MKIDNLYKYEDHQKYYELYTKNNTKLNEIIQNIISKYNFEYVPSKYYRLDSSNIITRNIYEISGIIFMLNSIIEKTFYGFCIKTGIKYACEKMYCSNNPDSKYAQYVYHFNCSNDEFIIAFSWEYFSPVLIYYPKTNCVYNISYRYSNVNISFLKNINYDITYYPKHNYTSYIIGLCGNAGHYFWQEIHGLMLLFEYNLIDNIDEFIIYKFDYLNIASILKNKFNKKIKHIMSENESHNLTVNITKHYIPNSSVEKFKTVYNLTNSMKLSQKNINIMFDIRSNSRVWLNQIPIIINIMNGLKHKYDKYNINFYISGFYKHNQQLSNNSYNVNKEVQTQNRLFYFIQSKVNFKIFNLINANLPDIINFCQYIDLCIANLGSGIGFYYSTIFNKPTIGFTNKKSSLDFDSQRYAFENKLNMYTGIHPSYITDIEDNFKLKNGVLFNSVIKKLDNILGKI
jgi:hypothetical protein